MCCWLCFLVSCPGDADHIVVLPDGTGFALLLGGHALMMLPDAA